MWNFYGLFFWGLITGIAGGALGIGGGSLIIPVLVLIYGLNQKSAQGISLMAMVPLAIVGALRYYLSPHIDINPRMAVLIALGSVIGVFLGTEIAIRVNADILKKAFAVFLMLIAMKMFFSKSSNSSFIDNDRSALENRQNN